MIKICEPGKNLTIDQKLDHLAQGQVCIHEIAEDIEEGFSGIRDFMADMDSETDLISERLKNIETFIGEISKTIAGI